MAYKNKEDQQRAWREHYARNPEKYADRNRRKKEELRLWLDSLKEGKPCRECGQTFPPIAMDWHHRDKEEKLFTIGSSSIKGYGRAKIEAELAKCDLLCAVCHRIIEHDPGSSNGRT